MQLFQSNLSKQKFTIEILIYRTKVIKTLTCTHGV